VHSTWLDHCWRQDSDFADDVSRNADVDNARQPKAAGPAVPCER